MFLRGVWKRNSNRVFATVVIGGFSLCVLPMWHHMRAPLLLHGGFLLLTFPLLILFLLHLFYGLCFWNVNAYVNADHLIRP